MKTKPNPEKAARRAVGGAFGKADAVTYTKLAKGTSIEHIIEARTFSSLPPVPTVRPEWMD